MYLYIINTMQTTCPSDIQGVRITNQPTNQSTNRAILHILYLTLRNTQEKTPSQLWETPTQATNQCTRRSSTAKVR